MGAVHTAAKRSPRSQDGTTITRSGGRMAAVTPRTIGCCSTRPATVKCTMPAVQRVYRILSQGCFERLEPDIRKPICPVLRGGGDGNAAPLPDAQKLQNVKNALGEAFATSLESAKWKLWHGNAADALTKLAVLRDRVCSTIFGSSHTPTGACFRFNRHCQNSSHQLLARPIRSANIGLTLSGFQHAPAILSRSWGT